jgi:hypothetical protein
MRFYETLGLARKDKEDEEIVNLEDLDRQMLRLASNMVYDGRIVFDPKTKAPRFSAPNKSLAGKARENQRKAAEFRRQRGD